MHTSLGTLLYCGLCKVGLKVSVLCKLIVIDSCPPDSTCQGNLYMYVPKLSSTVASTKQEAVNDWLHCDLSPCCCDSADTMSPEIKQTNIQKGVQ